MLKIKSLGAWDLKGVGRVYLIKSDGITLGSSIKIRGIVRRIIGIVPLDSEYIGVLLE